MTDIILNNFFRNSQKKLEWYRSLIFKLDSMVIITNIKTKNIFLTRVKLLPTIIQKLLKNLRGLLINIKTI